MQRSIRIISVCFLPDFPLLYLVFPPCSWSQIEVTSRCRIWWLCDRRHFFILPCFLQRRVCCRRCLTSQTENNFHITHINDNGIRLLLNKPLKEMQFTKFDYFKFRTKIYIQCLFIIYSLFLLCYPAFYFLYSFFQICTTSNIYSSLPPFLFTSLCISPRSFIPSSRPFTLFPLFHFVVLPDLS